MFNYGSTNHNSFWNPQIYSESQMLKGFVNSLKLILFQPKLHIPIPKDHERFYFFVHNKNQMYIPKLNNAFGSFYFYKNLRGSNCNSTCQQSYLLTRTRKKILNHDDQRCDESNGAANTAQCITSYLEERIGCSMGLYGSDPNRER